MRKVYYQIICSVILIVMVSLPLNGYSQEQPSLASSAYQIANQLDVTLDENLISNVVAFSSDEINALGVDHSFYVDQLADKGYTLKSEVSVFKFTLIDNSEVFSFIIPIENYEDKYLNIIKIGEEEYGVVLKSIHNIEKDELFFDKDSDIEIAQKITTIGGWMDCMGRFFSSRGGTFVALMGVASSVGCIACIHAR